MGSYLRKLRRATGEGWVVLEACLAPVRSEGPTLRDYLRRCWWLRAAKGGLELLRAYSLITLVQCLFRDMEGDDEKIAVEFDIGRLIELFRLRSRYSQVWWDIALAPWRRRNSLHQNLAVIAVPGCLLPDWDSAPVNDHSRIRPRRCETQLKADFRGPLSSQGNLARMSSQERRIGVSRCPLVSPSQFVLTMARSFFRKPLLI